MTLFPIMQPQMTVQEDNAGLYIEVAWDFEKNIPIYRNGSPVLVTGKEAVLVWAWNALHTPRFVHEIFTWGYGNEIEGLVGKPFTDELKLSEAARYVRECLLINPYITEVKGIAVDFLGSRLSISCTINTVYGEAQMHV
jgi:hypothetical protein